MANRAPKNNRSCLAVSGRERRFPCVFSFRTVVDMANPLDLDLP
jgi:hypothetical protein